MHARHGTARHDEHDPVYHHTISRTRDIIGELRLAPDHWLGEMQRGDDSPKYELIRAIDLRLNKLNATAVNKLLIHPRLIHLEALYLPLYLDLSKTLIKTLCHHDNTARLNTLKLSKFSSKSMNTLIEQGDTPRALRLLDLSNLAGLYQTEPDLLSIPWLSTLNELHIDSDRGIGLLDQCMHRSSPYTITTLGVQIPRPDYFEKRHADWIYPFFGHDYTASTITHLKLLGDCPDVDFLIEMLAGYTDPTFPEHLDVSEVSFMDTSLTSRAWTGAKCLKLINKLTLGMLDTAEHREALESAFPEIVLA